MRAAASQQLDSIFTNERIEHKLNSENVFDFEYTPETDDVLKIHYVHLYLEIKGKPRDYEPFIAFIFRDGRWQRDANFDSVFAGEELYRKGEVALWIDGVKQ